MPRFYNSKFGADNSKPVYTIINCQNKTIKIQTICVNVYVGRH